MAWMTWLAFGLLAVLVYDIWGRLRQVERGLFDVVSVFWQDFITFDLHCRAIMKHPLCAPYYEGRDWTHKERALHHQPHVRLDTTGRQDWNGESWVSHEKTTFLTAFRSGRFSSNRIQAP